MSIAQGRDLLRTTKAVAVGGAPSITSGSEFTTGVLDLESLDVRPSSIVFDLPIEFLIPEAEDVNYTSYLQKSADNSTWETIPGTTVTNEWSNSDEDDLTVRTSIRIGGDIIQSGARYIRGRGTVTRSDAGVTMTQRGMVAILGGLDETAAVPTSERQVI